MASRTRTWHNHTIGMKHRLPTALLALAFTACAQEIVVNDGGPTHDAGAPPRDGGFEVRHDGSVPDGGTVDGGTRDGGEDARDAGFRDGGPSNTPLTWAQMVLPPNTRGVNAIWGDGTGALYAGCASGRLLKLDTGGWTTIWQETSNHDIRAMGGTASRMFVASSSRLHVFDGEPGTATPTSYLPSQVMQIEALAVVSDTEAYFSATLFNGRALFRYNGSAITPIFQPTDFSVISALAWIDNALYIGGNGHMFRFDGAFTEETVSWPGGWDDLDTLMFSFRGIAEVDGRIFAVGDSDLIFERGGDTTWRIAYGNGAPGSSLNGVASVDGRAVAVGEAGNPAQPYRVFDGASWAPQSGPDVDLQTVFPVSANEWYVGGYASIDGVILRGIR